MLDHIVLGLFLFACCIKLIFRFAYRIAWSNGVDWFEITSDEMFVRQNSFQELEKLSMCNPFWCKNFWRFCKHFLFWPLSWLKTMLHPRVISTNVGRWSHFMSLIETLVDVLWHFEPYLDYFIIFSLIFLSCVWLFHDRGISFFGHFSHIAK